MSTNNQCPKCGALPAANSPEGLCPACLLKAGFAEPTVDSSVGAAGMVPAGVLPKDGEMFGPYRIVRLLGRGGMGAVYDAEHLESGRRIALKVLSHQLDSPDARARFLREGRLAASINHPNSVYVYGTDEINEMPVIAMELVAGGTLQERVQRQGPLPTGAAVDAVLQLIAGLEAAQAIGILHRDIKPANCFEDVDGTVKIGDFGLSISTAARSDTNLTRHGQFLGTPAFCSPEQLRGEELNARSDMYSVGVTLFYLLTGRTPFESDNMVKLLANVLEQPAPSPKKFQSQVPRDLARIVLRCLEKAASERFKNYNELRQALAPFSSTAPVPAGIGRRFLAGLLDSWFAHLIVTAIGFSAILLLKGQIGEPTNVTGYHSFRDVLINAIAFLVGILYFAVPEGLRGASLGKWMCGIRVTGPDRNPPGVARALLRAAIYVLLPALPVELSILFSPPKLVVGSQMFLLMGLAFTQYLVLALLFCTMRRRNGVAAIHDLLTKTRVIRKPAYQARPVLATVEEAAPATETKPKVGPYHVLASLEKTEACEWLLAYDTRLLRKIWLRVVPAGTPPILPYWRTLARIGRLRWINGRRTAQENWDAFEGVTGKPLVNLLAQPQSWAQVRYWLLDLATEISAAEKDGTLPGVLALDRVWITADGRAKLLDFRAPGAVAVTTPAVHDAKTFLNQLACAALAGRVDAEADAKNLRVPLPVHARKFLVSLPGLPTAEAIAIAVRALLSNMAVVTRSRRLALVLGCVALPILLAVLGVVGMTVAKRLMSQPDIVALNRILAQHMVAQMKLPWLKNQPQPPEQEVMIYIASHYRHVVTNAAVWQSLSAKSMKNRALVEGSIKEYPHPTAEQIEQATKAMKPYLDGAKAQEMAESFQQQYGIALLGGAAWIGIIGTWAVFAALLFRGGLVMLICNVAVVRKDGRRASRGRIFWRSLIAWSPVLFTPILLALITPLSQYGAAARDHRPVVVQGPVTRVAEELVRDMDAAAGVVAPPVNPATTSNAVATVPATNAPPSTAELGEVLSSAMLPWMSLGALFVLGMTIWSLSLRGRSLQDRLAGTTLVPR